MLPNNHRFTMLSADDVALCRAHSEAIEQDGYSRMLVAEVVVESDFKHSGRAVLPADLPLPPSYWDDLENWIKTLAPAKPAGPQPFQAPAAWDGVHRYGNRAEYDKALAALFVSGQAIAPTPMSYIDFSEAQWDGSPKTGVVGIGDLMIDCGGSTICNGASACRGFETKEHYRDWFRSLRDPGLAAQLASTSSAADGASLIGTKPAATAQHPAQKASTHSVCIRAYGVWKVGVVARWDGAKQEIPANWLPCDESGWVTHVPTADAVCPVPDGIEHQVRWRDGCETLGRDGFNWYEQEPGGHSSDIIAWRPIAQS